MNTSDTETPQAPRPAYDPPVLLVSDIRTRFILTTLQTAVDVFAEAGSFGGFDNDPDILPGHIVVRPDYDPKRFSPSGHVLFHAGSIPLPLPLCVVRLTGEGFVVPEVNVTRAEFLTPPKAHAWCALRPAVRIDAGRGRISLEQASRAWAEPPVGPKGELPVRLSWRLSTRDASSTPRQTSDFRSVWSALDFLRSTKTISGMHSPEITATETGETLLTREQIRRIL